MVTPFSLSSHKERVSVGRILNTVFAKSFNSATLATAAIRHAGQVAECCRIAAYIILKEGSLDYFLTAEGFPWRRLVLHLPTLCSQHCLT